MKNIRCTRAELRLLMVSIGLSVVMLAGAYEIFENFRYERWKSQFDVIGWLTVPSPNPVLMWEYRPHRSWEELKVNRWGFRDRDYEAQAKPANTHRIAFIGDSVTLGLRVAAEDIFVRRFEEGANGLGLGRTVQAMNFAVDGYNTIQIHEMLRTKTLAFEPDHVVYVLCLNDFDFEDSSGLKILYFEKPKSFLLQTLQRVYRQRIYQQFAGGDFHHYYFEKNKQTVFEKIRDMHALLGQKGIAFHVVVLPVFPDSAPDFAGYALRDVHREIGAVLRKHGIAHLDLLEAFAEQRKPPAHFARDIWHPNAAGHLLIANRMLDALMPGAGDPAEWAAGRSPRDVAQRAASGQDVVATITAACSNSDARIVHAAPAGQAPSAPHQIRSPESACMRTVATPDGARSPPPAPARPLHIAPGCCTPAAAPAH